MYCYSSAIPLLFQPHLFLTAFMYKLIHGFCMQVGIKHMLYMSLHAEATVDLVEIEHKEVQFRQVQGDFSLLQGKFMLQEGEPQVHFLTDALMSQQAVFKVLQGLPACKVCVVGKQSAALLQHRHVLCSLLSVFLNDVLFIQII